MLAFIIQLSRIKGHVTSVLLFFKKLIYFAVWWSLFLFTLPFWDAQHKKYSMAYQYRLQYSALLEFCSLCISHKYPGTSFIAERGVIPFFIPTYY